VPDGLQPRLERAVDARVDRPAALRLQSAAARNTVMLVESDSNDIKISVQTLKGRQPTAVDDSVQ
jgi:hypothetical protein